MQLKQLPIHQRTAVMFLHQTAFGGDSACKKACHGNCCNHCSNNKGYLREQMNDREWAIFARKYNFSTVRGFKTETGCGLPIEERSQICLTYMCQGSQTLMGYGPDKDKPFEEFRQVAVEKMMDIFIDFHHSGHDGAPHRI